VVEMWQLKVDWESRTVTELMDCTGRVDVVVGMVTS
jgi:hypothetical protein